MTTLKLLKPEIAADEILLDYFNREIEVDIGFKKEKTTFLDLIAYSYKKKNFDEWKKLTEEFLKDQNTNSASGWNIKLYEFPSEEEVASAITYEIIFGGLKRGNTLISIPTINTGDNIILRIYKRCQSEPC